MNTTMIIVLVVLFIVSLTLAYLGGKRWNVANATLLFFVVALEFLYVSTHVLTLHDRYRSQANEIQKSLDKVRADIKLLEFGNEDAEDEDAGVRELRHELHRLTLDRGRVWSDCEVDPQLDENGNITVRIANPDPHGIEIDKLLYAFEQGPAAEGNLFLSLGRVVTVGEGTVTAVPLRPTTPEQLEEYLNRGKKWRLYESLPVDRHDLLTSLSEEDLRAGLPAESIDEYLKDGKEASEDEPDERRIGFKADDLQALPNERDQVVKWLYVRRLRDFALRFDSLYAEQRMMQSDIEREISHIEAMKGSLAQAEQNVKDREEERGKLTQDFQKFQIEADRVGQHLAEVEQQRDKLETLLGDIRARTVELAVQLARWQKDATERIDRATSSQTAVGP